MQNDEMKQKRKILLQNEAKRIIIILSKGNKKISEVKQNDSKRSIKHFFRSKNKFIY